MHVHYEFLLDFIRKNSQDGTRSLDYGCGGGQVVLAGREEGLDIYGAEVFYEAGNPQVRQDFQDQGLLGSIVKEIKADSTGFPDEYFDLVVNNQVLEHVSDLDIVLREIHRVLKPRGVLLSIFPPRDTWREGHCGIPFLHKFPKASRLRILYAYLMRFLGLGRKKGARPKLDWVRHQCDFLDNYTFYRSRKTVRKALKGYFDRVEYSEHHYVNFRMNYIQSSLYPLFKLLSGTSSMIWLSQLVVPRLGNAVLEARGKRS